MRNYFNCRLCDKSIKIQSKKIQLNSQYHNFLSMSIISRYSVTNPDFLNIDNIIKNYVLDYHKEFAFYPIECKWTLHFSEKFTNAKSNKWYSLSTGLF